MPGGTKTFYRTGIRTLDENAQNITYWNWQYWSGGNVRLTDIELIRRMYNCEPAEELSENNPSGWVIKFSRAPKMRLKRNHLLTTLPILPTEWKVNFQLSARKKLNPPKKLYSIFHMSNANVDKISAIYFHPNVGLYIYNNGHFQGVVRSFLRVLAKKERKWIDIRMSQELVDGKLMFSVTIALCVFVNGEL